MDTVKLFCICCMCEPVFVNLLRCQGIDSKPGGPVRQPYLMYRLSRLHRLAESIPGLLKRLQIRALLALQTDTRDPPSPPSPTTRQRINQNSWQTVSLMRRLEGGRRGKGEVGRGRGYPKKKYRICDIMMLRLHSPGPERVEKKLKSRLWSKSLLR